MKISLQKHLLLPTALVKLASATLVITEVADKGTSDTTVCNGNGADWIEIHNSGTSPVDLFADGYILHDDKGFIGAEAQPFSFPPNTTLAAGDYMVVCTKMKSDTILSPSFGISGDDTITLATLQKNVYTLLSSVGPLPNTDDAFDVTYALNPTTGLYEYTSTPTPLAANKISPILTPEELVAKRKAQLAEQNSMGTKFFNMDEQGYPVPDAMDAVLDLHVSMEDLDYQYLLQNASYEVYRPFQSAKLTARDDPNSELWSLDTPGRIRPKGQSTLYFPLCLGTTAFPFQVEFGDRKSKNPFNFNETLFGAKTIFLRNHIGDNSFLRDWSSHRMAARFGLPHVRARQVRFLVNGNLHGLYTLLEAPDQEYVFARSFPHYNPNDFAFYKVKTQSLDCGNYPNGALEGVKTRLHETSTPPYAYERGEHRQPVEVLGPGKIKECRDDFNTNIFDSFEDAVLAYVRYDESCPDMLLGEGLIDRDLGTSNWDEPMKELIPNILEGHTEKSNLPNLVDEENTLKMTAFYAVTVNTDSPLGNGNNYYWSQTGEEEEAEGNTPWKMFPYDFNNARVLCGEEVSKGCEDHMVSWSIAQPTCTGFERNPVVGPLLADPALFDRYLEYVDEFVAKVYGNETFQEQILSQQRAIDADVREDYWSFGGINRDLEFSTDPADWKQGTMADDLPIFPLIPLMKARSQDVREQLEAIDIGTFPRGPHGIGVAGDYEDNEYCPDWRLEEPEETEVCPQDCLYEGCHTEGWTVESFCNKDFRTCFHGDFDVQCEGIKDGGKYDGIEDRDGRGTLCISVFGIPTKVSACPKPGEDKNAGQQDDMAAQAMEGPDFMDGMAGLVASSSSGSSFLRVGATISLAIGTLVVLFG